MSWAEVKKINGNLSIPLNEMFGLQFVRTLSVSSERINETITGIKGFLIATIPLNTSYPYPLQLTVKRNDVLIGYIQIVGFYGSGGCTDTSTWFPIDGETYKIEGTVQAGIVSLYTYGGGI